MANQFSDLFEYDSFAFVMNTCTAEYTNVTLLKDMCKKKAGTHIDKLSMNPKTGKFSIISTKVSASEHEVAKTLVEFKGVHTRFDDEDEETAPAPVPKKTRCSAYTAKGTVCSKCAIEGEVFCKIHLKSSAPPPTDDSFSKFKVYDGRKIHKTVKYDDAYEEIVQRVCDVGCTSSKKLTFSVDEDGCVVAHGKRLDFHFEHKKRIKMDLGKYSFALIEFA